LTSIAAGETHYARRAVTKLVVPHPDAPDSGREASVADRSTKPARPGPGPSPQIEVRVVREAGVAASRQSIIEGDVLRIGSHDSNDVVLADPLVSRLHCQIRNHPKGWRLVDTSSLNGTRVGGISVRDADLMLPQCTIAIGDSTLEVRALSSGAPDSSGSPAYGALYGVAPAMRRLFERLERIAKAPSDVLIEGESGTGKELIAAELVRRSGRADKPFIIVDCGAIAPNLVESELFGHARGAFTGAERARSGAFEGAEGGTVFLDEIGELPLEMQPKLLRALAAREVRRLGENETRRIDVRVIAATNRRLEGEVNRGKFREDLYFRLSVLRVDVPPLRERIEDLSLLIGAFLEQLGATEKLALFTPEVLEAMRQHAWPGNVRELRNYVERFAIFDGPLPDDPPLGSTPPPPAGQTEPASTLPREDLPFRQAKDRVIAEFERGYLTRAMAACRGNVSQAARKAGVDRMYLHRLLQRYGIRRGGSLSE